MRSRKRAYPAALLWLLLICWGCPSSSQPPVSDPDPGPSCGEIVEAWQSIQGHPYVWGGESVEEGGFDCSGAVYRVQKIIGRPVPRTTARKYYFMADGPETSWQKAGCGSWAWWEFSADRQYGHIGMMTRTPEAWQSGSSTGPTRIRFSPGGFWDKRFVTAKEVTDG